MSEENLEIVRRLATEFTETQRVSELVAPDAVWDLSSWSARSGQQEFHGIDGSMAFFAEWTDARGALIVRAPRTRIAPASS